MKKIPLFIISIILIFSACTSPNLDEAVNSQNISIDESLFGSDWNAVDLTDSPDMQAYELYYINSTDEDSYVVLTFSPHYDDAGDDLDTELKRNLESYTETTIPYSTHQSEIGEISYYDLDGFPACSFDIKAKLGTQSEEFLAHTVFVATEKGIYCLQLQSSSQNYENHADFFGEVKNSLGSV